MSLTVTALQRAMAYGLSEAQAAHHKKQQQVGYDQLQEIEHQFQVAIEGIATPNLTWTYVDIPFDVDFLFAPQQRDSPLPVPHFSFGSEVKGEAIPPDPNNPLGHVGIHATVAHWGRDHRNTVNSARVAIGVVCGGPAFAAQTVDFNGQVHLRFQGLGVPGGADSGDNAPALGGGS